MKVILIGKGQMLANMIESARESGVKIVGVLRYERMSLPRWKRVLHDLFATSHDLTLIKKYKLPEIKVKSANSDEFRDFILKSNADLLMVGTWREKLLLETIIMPKIGTVNVHPSLLPRYRGPNPYAQVILRGEKKTGVTIHLMDENFDSGAILLQKEVDILPSDTGKELRERIFAVSRDLMTEFLIKIQTEIMMTVKQNESRATYFGNLDEKMRMLDFKNNTAEEICAIVRALHPWLPCYITVGNRFFKVNPYKVSVLSPRPSTLAETVAQNIVDYDKPYYPDKLEPAQIVSKDSKKRSLTIVCKDGKTVKFERLRLWGFFSRPFTGFFIKDLKSDFVD